MLPFFELFGCFGACGTLLGLLGTVFWFWMLIECVTKEPSEGNTQLIWVLVIVLLPFLGSLLYFFLRRPDRIRDHGA